MSFLARHETSPGDLKYLNEDLDLLAHQQGVESTPVLSQHFNVECPETGRIAAEAIVDHRYGIAQIKALAVHEDFRRQGNGRKLLGMIEDFSRASDIRYILSETMTWECAELYKRCGFDEKSRVPLAVSINGVGQELVHYEKHLA